MDRARGWPWRRVCAPPGRSGSYREVGGRRGGGTLSDTNATARPAGHGPVRWATACNTRAPPGKPAAGSNIAPPLAGLSAAPASSAAPSSATTVASSAAWWWRSNASWSCMWPWAAWDAVFAVQSAAFAAVSSCSCPWPNTFCRCQRLFQLLARLDTAVVTVDGMCRRGGAWLCKEPKACWRVMVRPMSATASSNSQARHCWPAVCATRWWVIFCVVSGPESRPPLEYADKSVLDSVNLRFALRWNNRSHF